MRNLTEKLEMMVIKAISIGSDCNLSLEQEN